MNSEILLIPEEYLKKSKDELKVIAKKLYDRSVSDLYYNKDLNPDFNADKNAIKMLIDPYIYAMCCSDGNVNQTEMDFMISLNSNMSSIEWQQAMPKQLTKEEIDFLSNIATNDELLRAVRNIIRTSLIAASIDTASVNTAENKFLLDLLSCAGF